MRVISLGAGVQSTVIVLMALRGDFDPAPDCAIFADTGWEPEGVYDNLERLKLLCRASRFPLYTISAGNIRSDVLDSVLAGKFRKVSMPLYLRDPVRDGRLRRSCTREYKIDPVRRKIRELLGLKKGQRVPKGTMVEQWLGITTDEAHRTKPTQKKWLKNAYPLIDLNMSRNDCIQWCCDNGHPIPEKSACIGCPYHASNYWVDMKKKQPEAWEDAVDFDEKIRKGKLPGVTGDAYVHRRCLPLKDIGETYAEGDQLSLFGEECEGICGT